MGDMSAVIVPKSDQLNAEDLLSGPRTITITGINIRAAGSEQPVTVRFEGDEGRPWKPCKTMSKLLVHTWGPDSKNYIGKSLTLFRDPKVKWAGMEVGGIRVRDMTDIPADEIDSQGRMVVMLMETRGQSKPHVIRPLKQPAGTATADKIADGVNALLARIEAQADIAALIAEPEVVKQRAWLADKRPELAARIDAAIAAKAPASDEENPFSDNAPDEETADDETTTRLANIRNSIAAAKNAKGMQHVEAEWGNARAAYDDDTVAEIEQLIAERKRAIERREEG
jgi:hypothetical protein